MVGAADNYETDVMRYTAYKTASFSANTDFYISLHTADPGEAGDQSTTEATYTSYARVQVGRTSATLSVSTNVMFNVAAITFPAGTGGSGTVTHFGVGQSSTAGVAGTLYFSGALTSNLATGSGVTPSFGADQLRISAN